MGREIYVCDSALNNRISLTTNGSLNKLSIEPKSSISLVEGVYLGKVIKVVSGIDGAFIDCGLSQDAFLNFAGVIGGTNPDDHVLDKGRLTEGSKILVQVKSDARDGKGPRVSTKISLIGRYAVFSPDSGSIRVSRRITGRDERARLTLVASGNKEANEGIVLRTAARGQSSEKISNDIAGLRKIWTDIERLEASTESIGLLRPALTVTERFLRDYLSSEVESVLVTDRNKLEEVKGYCETYCPELVGLVQLPTGHHAKMVEESLEEQLGELGDSSVRLPSGGRVYFDETRSMTTVDVDTGRHSGRGNRSAVAFQTNFEAASMLGRQVCLRNIGGLIVIDFVGMKYAKDKERVLGALRISLNEDSVPFRMSGFSEFGVVELTRYRRGFSYASVMREICPTCEGDGRVQNISAVIDEILLTLRKEISFSQGTKFSVVGSDRTINFIKEYYLGNIGEIEQTKAVSIKLIVDYAVGGLKYRILPG